MCRHPVIHMYREQCFLSEVTQFSQNSVYLRCATCLPKIITNDKAFKFTAALRGSHADNRGASHSEAYGVMWTNKRKEKRSNSYRFAILHCWQDWGETFPSKSIQQQHTFKYDSAFQVDKSSYCFSMILWHIQEKLKNEMSSNESYQDFPSERCTDWPANPSIQRVFVVSESANTCKSRSLYI